MRLIQKRSQNVRANGPVHQLGGAGFADMNSWSADMTLSSVWAFLGPGGDVVQQKAFRSAAAALCAAAWRFWNLRSRFSWKRWYASS